MEAGFIAQWARGYFKISKCEENARIADVKPLTLHQSLGIFALLVIGLVSALIVLSFEYLYYKAGCSRLDSLVQLLSYNKT